MAKPTCFVIMPIGDQKHGKVELLAQTLKERYTDLIREAILKARPDLDVLRADEVQTPGGITRDVFTRLMHSDYVVADITFPNPNVFYELGIQHACRYGTLLIRADDGPKTPFDIVGERYIEYSNSPTGLKNLSQELRGRFDWFDANRTEPDSEFQKLAQFTKYSFPLYKHPQPDYDITMARAAAGVIIDPELRAFISAKARGEKLTPEDSATFIDKLADKPEQLTQLILAFIKSGEARI